MNPKTTDKAPAEEPDIRRMISELADGAAVLGDLIPPDVQTLIREIADDPWSRGD